MSVRLHRMNMGRLFFVPLMPRYKNLVRSRRSKSICRIKELKASSMRWYLRDLFQSMAKVSCFTSRFNLFTNKILVETLLRVYTDSESVRGYEFIFTRVFGLYQCITGERLKFHYIDGSGIKSIVSDMCPKQMTGKYSTLITSELCLYTSKRPWKSATEGQWIYRRRFSSELAMACDEYPRLL